MYTIVVLYVSYINKLEGQIIKQNSLKDFDDVKLLPSSELIKKII